MGWAGLVLTEAKARPAVDSFQERMRACKAPPTLPPPHTHIPYVRGPCQGHRLNLAAWSSTLGKAPVAEFQKPTFIRGRTRVESDMKEPAPRGHSLTRTWEATLALAWDYGPAPQSHNSENSESAARAWETRPSPTLTIHPEAAKPSGEPHLSRGQGVGGHTAAPTPSGTWPHPCLRVCPLSFQKCTGHLPLLHSEATTAFTSFWSCLTHLTKAYFPGQGYDLSGGH